MKHIMYQPKQIQSHDLSQAICPLLMNRVQLYQRCRKIEL